MAECHIWELTDSDWDSTDFNWNEICVAVEVVKRGGGYSEQFKRLQRRSKKDQKTFIKLLCKIKGEDDCEETKYFRPNIRVKASDFKLIERFLEKPEMKIFINKRK